MKYSEFKALLEEMKTKFIPGVKFDNLNIGGTTIHTITTEDRLAMMGEGTIVICVNGILGRNVLMDPSDKTGKMIRVYADGKAADILNII